MAAGVPTNNQRGQRSGPCRLWGGLGKARHIVPTTLLVRVQCFRKGLYKAVQGPSTRPLVLLMINWSYRRRRRRRLTIFETDEMKFGVSLTSLVCKLDHRRRPGERFIFLERNFTKFRQKFVVWSKELSKCFSKLVISIILCKHFWNDLEIFRMEIQNASTTPSKSNQLRNVNTVRWETGNVTT